jgi:hypothetical protein
VGLQWSKLIDRVRLDGYLRLRRSRYTALTSSATETKSSQVVTATLTFANTPADIQSALVAMFEQSARMRSNDRSYCDG